MNDKASLPNYKISWTEVYPFYEGMQEQLVELRLEQSDLSEANEVIARIMSL
jgi:hypothetical protein